MLPKLPPTLYIHTQFAILRCSKAPRGLSVLLRGTRIFAGATISPSFSLRQSPSRYAFHAGRYLADKEFRSFCSSSFHLSEAILFELNRFPTRRRADRTISSPTKSESSVWPLGISRRTGIFPADCLHPKHCHIALLQVAWDSQMFQHIARFY